MNRDELAELIRQAWVWAHEVSGSVDPWESMADWLLDSDRFMPNERRGVRVAYFESLMLAAKHAGQDVAP